MAPGGPVFALTSYASAGDSGRKMILRRPGELRRPKQVVLADPFKLWGAAGLEC